MGNSRNSRKPKEGIFRTVSGRGFPEQPFGLDSVGAPDRASLSRCWLLVGVYSSRLTQPGDRSQVGQSSFEEVRCCWDGLRRSEVGGLHSTLVADLEISLRDDMPDHKKENLKSSKGSKLLGVLSQMCRVCRVQQSC